MSFFFSCLIDASMMKKRRLAEDEVAEEEEDTTSELIKSRGDSVYFYADVSKKNVLILLDKMFEALKFANEHETPDRPRRVGGCAYAALSALHHLEHFPCKVVTVADGFCASAATILFMAGSERKITPYASVLIHQLRTSFFGKYQDLKDEFKNSTELMTTLRGIYEKHTKMPQTLLTTCLEREECLSAASCVEHSIAHAFA
jgi:ATP-dependent protease ClpP protease subunit